MTTLPPPTPPSEIRRPTDRQALVRCVRDTPGLQEHDWLEWKSGYNLEKKSGRASIAKHLIGFANRDPDAAARCLNGHGCLLLGVEPGVCPGMPDHDSADLENWLRPFVGEKVVFDVHYVLLDGARVLFLAVEPPRLGDDIHCLRRGSEDVDTGHTMREGTIFVRKVGKTEPATAADIDRLTERARRVGMSLTLDLHVLAPVKTLDPIFLSEEFREEQLGKRRAQLQASLPAPSSGLLASIDRLTPGENRTRDRFIAEIDRFVDDAEREWDTLVAVKELEHDPSKLRLELVNESDDNFSDVVLEVTLPLARAQVHLSGSEAEERLNPPAEPPSWGNGVLGGISVVRTATQGLTPAELVEQSETSTLVRFFPIQVRPRTRHAMPEVLLALPPFMAGQTLEAPWRATSSSTRGDKPDAVEIEIVLPDA